MNKVDNVTELFILLYLADLMTRGITGQSIGQHLDNAVGGPLVEW